MRYSLRGLIVVDGGWKGISKEAKEAGCEWLVTKVFYPETQEVNCIWTDLDRKRRRDGASYRPWLDEEAKFEMNWDVWKVLEGRRP